MAGSTPSTVRPDSMTPIVVEAIPLPVAQGAATGGRSKKDAAVVDLSALEGRWRASRNDFSGFGHCCCQRWISIERNIWKDESGDIQGTETVNVTLCGCLPGQNYGHIVAEAAALQEYGHTLPESNDSTLWWSMSGMHRAEYYVSDTLANVETTVGGKRVSYGTVRVSRCNEMHYEESTVNGDERPAAPGLLAAHTTLTLRYKGPPKVPAWSRRQSLGHGAHQTPHGTYQAHHETNFPGPTGMQMSRHF